MRPAATTLLLCALAAHPPPSPAQAFDPARSRVEFEVRTRVGTLVRGDFPAFEGRVDTLPDGRRRVHVRLASAQVRVGDSPRYTALARGPQLFDAARHPWIEFVSEPHAPELARTGGPLPGHLRLRGVERGERFELKPAACARPGLDCAVLAQGRVSRDDYGLTGWRWALADRVRFKLHVRLVD